MRVYFLRLTQADFTLGDSTYRSGAIDLFDNPVYTNYSVTRSGYGLNDLGDGTWTGLRYVDASTTDTGELVFDGATPARYVDTSGRIDLVSWNAEGGSMPRLTVHTARSATAFFPDEYVAAGPYTPADELNLVDSPRWARFDLTFEAPLPATFALYVRVEIDQPLMAPLYRASRAMLDQFPGWMAMRELDTANPLVPELATPVSLGGSLLNAMAGEWLEELSNSITYLELQNYIDSADLNTTAWVYRVTPLGATPAFANYLWSITGDGVQLARAFDLAEFYGAAGDVCYWDEHDDVLYTGRHYDVLLVNDEVHGQEPHHVWNVFDDFGLLVDLWRHRGEENESFRARILDVHRNRPGVGVENFKLALRRELNIWQVYNSTPDSSYVGATPEVLEISDLERDPIYVDPDGMPTKRFVDLVDHLAKTYPTTWGYFRWDKARWDMGGPNHEGYGVLPYRFDATPLAGADVQAGVGDANDLLLLRPDAPTGPHDFTARLKLRGRHMTSRDEYPTVEFELEMYGSSDRKIYSNAPKVVWLTAEVTVTGGAKYAHSFQLSSTSDVDVDRPTPSDASLGVYRIFDDDGSGTDDLLTFSHQVTGVDYPASRIPLADITSVDLRSGKWSVASQAYILNEASDTFAAWFSHNAAVKLLWDTAAGAVPTMVGGADSPQSAVVLQSKVTSYVVGKWTSEVVPYRVRLNDALPNTEAQPVDVPVPPIIWDPYQEAVPNRELVVQLTTRDAPGAYGGMTTDESGAPVFVPASYIRVDGAAPGWTNGKITIPVPASGTLEFSTGTGALYPVTATVWTMFEATQTASITGIVDEYGPWRNNLPSSPGNTNFALRSVEVDRSDFGVANDADYVVTWMGVDVDDPRVIAWLDCNTVKPAVVDASEVVYPANAIEETFAAGTYSYAPFTLRVRLRIDPDPRWNPYLHSGWYYQGGREGYVFADPAEETTTAATYNLAGVVRQGAPIIVRTTEATPRELRQVAFFDPAVSPPTLSLVNRETVSGSGTTTLYLAHADVYNVSVVDLTTGLAVASASSTTTSELTTTAPTVRDRQYEVTYKLARSFTADHQWVHADGSQRTRILIDKTAAALGVPGYVITYETARFDPATPVDMPLSPLYTSLSEGFIFLSHDEYSLDRVEVTIAPTKLVADGSDYALVTMRSLDRYGNPKADQSFTVATTFGTLSDTTVTTDTDGFAAVLLTAGLSAAASSGTLTISGAANASLTFMIDPAEEDEFRLLAIPAAEQIPADGRSLNVVYGRLEDSDFAPVAGATIHWKRARSLYDLFNPTPPAATPAQFEGEVTTGVDGGFTIGNFTAQPPEQTGYWFLVAEVDDGSAGDIVFWHEYPDVLYGAQPFTGLPRPSSQEATPTYEYEPYSDVAQFPSYYDEATPYAPATPVYGTGNLNWLPPTWFAIPKYAQYQLGLLGATRGQVTYSALVHKYRKAL